MIALIPVLLCWLLALGWLWKTFDGLRGLSQVERLDQPAWDVWPDHLPGLTVVVPGRDEAANIGATLASLTAQDYSRRGALRIVAVDDRSVDQTGPLMDEFAAAHPELVSVLHIRELPEGWLGKTHALDAAVQMRPHTEYLLFTDADVRFAPSTLRRTLAYAEREQLDHLTVLPTMDLNRWSEGILLGVFHTFILWAARPWKVSDPRAKRDVIGVGAFNLVRRSALQSIGGLKPQAMVVLEDITIARRIKSAGLRTRVAFAPGMVRVHWAKGIRGQMGVMGKNLFSAFNFALLPALFACVSLAALGLVPVLGLFWSRTAIPALIVLVCIALMYRMCEGFSSIAVSYAWTYPFAALLFSATIVRSVAVVLRDGGVWWRGTLYPLRELREHNSPFRWER